MKDVFMKLRIKLFVCFLHLKFFCFEITKPFRIAISCIERYLVLRKIDKESENGWERHVKIRELDEKDELEIKRGQFQILKTHIIGAFFRTCICAGAQILDSETNKYQQDFQDKKEELICLLEKLCNYQEINFDENIKSEIISWELGKFETQEALSDWSKRFSEYICTLDII